jgi:beta-galactosidase/beta-glucuronidase
MKEWNVSQKTKDVAVGRTVCVNRETERLVVIKELNMNNVRTTVAPKYLSD